MFIILSIDFSDWYKTQIGRSSTCQKKMSHTCSKSSCVSWDLVFLTSAQSDMCLTHFPVLLRSGFNIPTAAVAMFSKKLCYFKRNTITQKNPKPKQMQKTKENISQQPRKLFCLKDYRQFLIMLLNWWKVKQNLSVHRAAKFFEVIFHIFRVSLSGQFGFWFHHLKND